MEYKLKYFESVRTWIVAWTHFKCSRLTQYVCVWNVSAP